VSAEELRSHEETAAVRFRCGVGMAILDGCGRVLTFERADAPGSFQLPQGGMEDDESPIGTMWRELGEETGLSDAHVAVVAEVPEWLGYELPPVARSNKTGRGQVQKWFILRAVGDDLPIVVGDGGNAEFRSWRWSHLSELADQVVPFRRPVYRRLAAFVAALEADPPPGADPPPVGSRA